MEATRTFRSHNVTQFKKKHQNDTSIKKKQITNVKKLSYIKQYVCQLFSLRNFILCLRGDSQQALIPFGLVQRTYVMQGRKKNADSILMRYYDRNGSTA